MFRTTWTMVVIDTAADPQLRPHPIAVGALKEIRSS